MASGGYRFENFSLDPGDRQLRRDNMPVDLNARYFDALALLVREQGRLVSKDRFLEEVWRGMAVTDEALTQCIKTIRRQLGDSAASPRFIETVPKHGYRFIAPVDWIGENDAADAATTAQSAPQTSTLDSWRQFFLLGGAGTIGGGVAGIAGGLFYGLAGVSQSLQADMGGLSVLLVIICLSIVMGLAGGAGVAFGIAAASFTPGRTWQWSIVGGAAGGMIVGAFVKMIGLDAFNLLLGQSPGDITGATEGMLLGGAAGFGLWLGNRDAATSLLRRSVVAATLAGGTAGILIPLYGGRLMGGSLDLLTHSFPTSRFRLDQIGVLFGEQDFGLISQIITGCLEGALFSGCIAGTMMMVRRALTVKD